MKSKRSMLPRFLSAACNSRLMELIGAGRRERISLAINQIIKPRVVRRAACCSANIRATTEA